MKAIVRSVDAPDIEVKEFDWIKLPGELVQQKRTIRFIMVVKGREFVRLFEHGYKPIWREENQTGFIEGKEYSDLESIFKAWCLKNNKDVNNPEKLLKK